VIDEWHTHDCSNMRGEPQAFGSGQFSALRDTSSRTASKAVSDLDTLATKVQGAAIGTYVAATYTRGYDFRISTLFWGAVIVIALFVSCLLAWKAIEWVRNRKSDCVVVEVHLKDPEEPWDPWENAISRPPQTITFFPATTVTNWACQREHEPARAGRRKAREQAQKKQHK
jgi:hypothetical protein